MLSDGEKQISDDYASKITSETLTSLMAKSHIYFSFIENNPLLFNQINEWITNGNPVETMPSDIRNHPEVLKLMEFV